MEAAWTALTRRSEPGVNVSPEKRRQQRILGMELIDSLFFSASMSSSHPPHSDHEQSHFESDAALQGLDGRKELRRTPTGKTPSRMRRLNKRKQEDKRLRPRKAGWVGRMREFMLLRLKYSIDARPLENDLYLLYFSIPRVGELHRISEEASDESSSRGVRGCSCVLEQVV